MQRHPITHLLLTMAVGCTGNIGVIGDDRLAGSDPTADSDSDHAADSGPTADSQGNGDSDADGNPDTDGDPDTDGASDGDEGAVDSASYRLPAPSQCHNQDYVDYSEGCIEGDATSKCQGKCSVINACQESHNEKPHADVTFACPRYMLFSAEMLQAATDDGNSTFNYAVVGHDVDREGVDGDAESTCCQCYQLVFAYPSPNNDRQALENPDDPNPPISAIAIPKPLIVQSFNTGATPYTFDVYMAAGGFGANNACAPGQMPEAQSGQYLYTDYPTDGQPSQGGVKPASLYQECKTAINWVTADSLSSEACQGRVAEACGQMDSNIPGLAEQSRSACIRANAPQSHYHLNWSVYAMKVECPENLTRVTGCKLAPQNLPEVDPTTTTAAQAAIHPAFFDSNSNGNMYETTTMEDCCRPSCASMDWVSGRGLTTDDAYNAFYACDADGVPFTE